MAIPIVKTLSAFLLIPVLVTPSILTASEATLYPAVKHQSGQTEAKVLPVPTCEHSTQEIIAGPIRHPLGSQTGPQKLPAIADWNTARPAVFCQDWKGNSDPQSKTEVQVLWTNRALYFRFVAHYRDLYVFPEIMGRREKLWQRDVAEVFLQPDTQSPDRYKEVEVSPGGDWLDLDIFPGGTSSLKCDLKTDTTIDEQNHVWVAHLVLPMKCITPAFDPHATWKLNLFRIEGSDPNRHYFAWQPTNTPQPNFHVPKVFGTLKFSHD